MGKDKFLVSIIYVAYNQPKILKESIISLIENTTYENYEIIISHNKTIPTIDEEIRNFSNEISSLYNKKILYIYNSKNLKFGPGIMEGFKLSSGSLICTMNDDTFFSKENSNWLEKLVEKMEEDPFIATITPSMYHKNKTIYWIGKKKASSKFHDFLHAKENDPRLPKELYESCYNNMACCLIRRELVEEFPIGKYHPHYGSDSDFCFRIKKKYEKMKHVVFPESKIFHFNIYQKRKV